MFGTVQMSCTYNCMCASPYIYIYISYIKCNVVTVYERILICFIIYRNAILTFLTLFDKYVFEKKIINFMLKNNKNREEVAWFFTPQEDQIKTTVCLVLYKRAVHTTVCVTRKMAGVGHLALYWARSSLRAARRLMNAGIFPPRNTT